MSATSDGRLPFDAPGPPAHLEDAAARRDAVDPRQNVVLEASAGTGKTRVLVDRYLNLLQAGVDPAHILAITFTRKAASEMRERILQRFRETDRESPAGRALKARLGDIAISTIDAFCLSLLRAFPLEADVDPGFGLADDADVARLRGESLDRALRICRGLARDVEDVELVFAQLGERRLRAGLSTLIDRRLLAVPTLRAYLSEAPRDLTVEVACRRVAERLCASLGAVQGGLRVFLDDGPLRHPSFAVLARDLEMLAAEPALASRASRPALRASIDRARAYFLTQDGRPRERAFAGTGFTAADFPSAAARQRHRHAAAAMAPAVADAWNGFRRDLNAIVSRGVWRVVAVALEEYERTLEAHGLLDFTGVLERALRLLEGMDEFAPSRFRLEARYRHVLVDEFQDTSRVQWQLVAQLVRNWGEGLGASSDAIPPSIFLVGDRKQSIYGFRDADAGVLDEAASLVSSLRDEGSPRRAISVSFRAQPALLAFINDVFGAVDKAPERQDGFRYEPEDQFLIASTVGAPAHPVGLVVGSTVTATAARVAEEIERLAGTAPVRDRATGVTRRAGPGDVAILFRTRDAHQEFEKALQRRGLATYVYKGLGFFDAPEVQDAVAVIRYLADPLSDFRAASFLRSGLIRLSDACLARLAPSIATSLLQAEPQEALRRASGDDRSVLDHVRRTVPAWLSLVDRVTPLELLERVFAESGHRAESARAGGRQARENLKKLQGMVARFQNRGYATLARVAAHLDDLSAGDEANAAIDARDAVSLMTVHAAKGLEFPVVFVANMNRGTGSSRAPVRVSVDRSGSPSVAVADYQSEADEDAQARDREETKRLLYVALTRARDRLYLCGTVRDGQFRPTRGSLGEVLPASLKAVLGAAAIAGGPVTWVGGGGRTHSLRVP